MLEYNEIRGGKYILYNNEPFEVLESHVARTQQRKPQNQTKLRSLLSGRVVSATFHASDKVTEADIGSKKIKFLYHNRGEFWFCEINDPSRRFSLEENLIGEPAKFLKGNTMVDALTFTGDDEDDQKLFVSSFLLKWSLLSKMLRRE